MGFLLFPTVGASGSIAPLVAPFPAGKAETVQTLYRYGAGSRNHARRAGSGCIRPPCWPGDQGVPSATSGHEQGYQGSPGTSPAPSSATAKTPANSTAASENRNQGRQRHPWNKQGFIQTSAPPLPSPIRPNKNKGTSFPFSSFITHLKKIKQNPGQPQDSYFYGDHPARLLLHKDVINAIYSSANNWPLCCSVGESCGRIITEAIPAKPNSAWPHAGRAKAAISWRPGCKIKLN